MNRSCHRIFLPCTLARKFGNYQLRMRDIDFTLVYKIKLNQNTYYIDLTNYYIDLGITKSWQYKPHFLTY